MPLSNTELSIGRSYLLLLLTGAMTILVLIGLLIALTNRINERAAVDTRERFELILNEWQEALELGTKDYAYWTLAYQLILSGDADAVLDNIGSGATQSDLFDWIVILDSDGSVKYAFDFPESEEPETVFDETEVSTLLSLLSKHDPAEYQPVSGAIRVGEEVSLVSTAWVTPDDMTRLEASQLPVLICGITLDAEKQLKLLRSTDADAIGISAEAIKHTEIAHKFEGPFGISGHLSLTPKTPGRALRAEALPWLLAFCTVVALVTISVARHIRSLGGQLNRAIILASTDPLTGLSNRAALQSFIETPLIEHALGRGDIAVLNLDLNGFKQLNDQHGHAAGDVALKVTAERLKHAVRDSDRVVRLGGDEFLCLIVDQNPKEVAKLAANRITESFSDPIDFGSFKSHLYVSIGIAVGDPGDNWGDLTNRADAAMYRAKKSGQPHRLA